MRVYLLLLTTGALVMGGASGASAGCVYSKEFAAGQTFQVLSPNYPNNYSKGVDCLWEAVAPSNSKLTLSCSIFSLPYSTNCIEDRFSVSLSGDSSMSDAHLYCGTGSFSTQSTNNRLAMKLTAMFYSSGGKFSCSVTASVPTTPQPSTCDCGWKNEPRIVNGYETGVNEYPMMAGLVDFQLGDVVCGTTIISNRYCLSAAHCLLNRQTVYTGVLVGDHDISTGAETNSAKLLRVESFLAHPLYNSLTQENDIAVIRVAEDIVFSLQVGPACLPFRNTAAPVGSVVEVLGWGLTEFTGEKSNKLLGTELYVTDISRCQKAFGSKVSSTKHLCTYKSGTDACKADSGGPVLWMGASNRLQLVGVISYSKGCASEYPGVNTHVNPYIDWIRSVTPGAQYCVI